MPSVPVQLRETNGGCFDASHTDLYRLRLDIAEPGNQDPQPPPPRPLHRVTSAVLQTKLRECSSQQAERYHQGRSHPGSFDDHIFYNRAVALVGYP
jgi:hypothetical protein